MAIADIAYVGVNFVGCHVLGWVWTEEREQLKLRSGCSQGVCGRMR